MKTWKWWKKLVVGVLVGITAVLLYAFLPVPQNLSELESLGTQYDVTILRDTWGVPHIFGRSDADASFGLAYAHAQDDFLTIQQALVAARGHLATVYGADAAPNDYMVQLLRIWQVVDSQYESQVSPEAKAVLQGYADGLNYYAALHTDEILAPGLFPVREQDVIAGFIHRVPLFFGIDGALGELFEAERQRELSTKEVGDWGLEILQTPNPQLPITNLLPLYGSNTFAVSPARSANGETFFAVNSHQPWEGIAAWYEAYVHSEEGWNMAGGLLPGSPTITHGHNENLAWAFTVNSPDLVDTYVLEMNPDNPNQYRFDGEWRDLEVGTATLWVKVLGRIKIPVRQEILWSVYGPTVRQDHGVYAIRFAGWGNITFVDQFLRLNKAQNLAEWQAALADGPLPMFNVGYADREGNIYYVYNGLLPVRAEGYDWEQYLPGNTSETLWTAYVPFEQLPQVLNPPSGFIQNANSNPFRTTFGPGNPDPANFSATLGIETQMSNRALRLLELFEADEAVTADSFYTYKYDMAYSTESDVAQFRERLLAASLPQDDEVQTAVNLLREWDLQTTPDTVGMSVMAMTLQCLYELDNDTIRFNISKLSGSVVPDDVLADCFVTGVERLLTHFGRLDVPWQALNRLIRGEVDLGLGGGPDILHAVYGHWEEDGRFRGIAGDSFIMLVQWDVNGQLTSQSLHQYGSATLDTDSPHYADQAPLFVQRQLRPVWFTESEIRVNLESEYRPGEEE